MCKICTEIDAKDIFTEDDVSYYLDAIAKAMESSYDDHLNRPLDRLLGTGLNERDVTLDEAWEHQQRGSNRS